VAGAVAALVGLSVAHRRGLGPAALLAAIGCPILVAVLLLAVGGRNGTASVLDLIAVLAGTAVGTVVSRRLSGALV
jgi:hypothetical protein